MSRRIPWYIRSGKVPPSSLEWNGTSTNTKADTILVCCGSQGIRVGTPQLTSSNLSGVDAMWHLATGPAAMGAQEELYSVVLDGDSPLAGCCIK